MAFKNFKKLFLSLADFEEAQNILRVVNTLQSNIDSAITPILNKTQLDSTILTNVSLKTGQVNVISHLLNRNLTGWKLVRQRGQASIWDSQDSNTSPGLTLLLNTSANVVVDIEVF